MINPASVPFATPKDRKVNVRHLMNNLTKMLRRAETMGGGLELLWGPPSGHEPSDEHDKHVISRLCDPFQYVCVSECEWDVDATVS